MYFNFIYIVVFDKWKEERKSLAQILREIV